MWTWATKSMLSHLAPVTDQSLKAEVSEECPNTQELTYSLLNQQLHSRLIKLMELWKRKKNALCARQKSTDFAVRCLGFLYFVFPAIFPHMGLFYQLAAHVWNKGSIKWREPAQLCSLKHRKILAFIQYYNLPPESNERSVTQSHAIVSKEEIFSRDHYCSRQEM